MLHARQNLPHRSQLRPQPRWGLWFRGLRALPETNKAGRELLVLLLESAARTNQAGAMLQGSGLGGVLLLLQWERGRYVTYVSIIGNVVAGFVQSLVDEVTGDKQHPVGNELWLWGAFIGRINLDHGEYLSKMSDKRNNSSMTANAG